jgi:hypothetical protein
MKEVRRLSSQLPLELTSLIGIECRLGESLEPMGFFIHVSHAAAEVLARLGHTRDDDASIRDQSWRRLAVLAQTWQNASTALHEKLLAITLEFDLPLKTPRMPSPLIFLSMADAGLLTPESDGSWCWDQALPALYNRRLDPNLRALAEQCLHALRSDGGICDIGVLLAREPQVLRLQANLPPSDIVSYLRRIGWPGSQGDFRLLQELITELGSAVDRIKLCVDIADGVSPHLGLECSLSVARSLSMHSWATLLDFLSERGLCQSQLYPRLLSYPGVMSIRDAEDRWPSSLRTASQLLGSRYTSLIVRNISHVKLSVLPGLQVGAKVYLYAGYVWRRNVAQIQGVGTAGAVPLTVGQVGLDLADALLRKFSADSLYLFERLIEEFESDSFDADEPSKERLSKWINAVSAAGSREAWLRYVMAEGLNETRAGNLLRALGPTISTLPDWANLLGEVLLCGTVGDTITEAARPPFDELWEPFRTTFRRYMTARFPKGSSMLSLTALHDLERSLSTELSSMALTTIFPRFSAYRLARLGPFAAMASPGSDEIYRAYVRHEFADALGSLFGRYPVLGRRLADRTLKWIEGHIEMLERLGADRLLISQQFFQGCAPGPLESIVPAISDFHASGRSAAVLRFSSGLTIVYKPRLMGLEREFNAFLSKLNDQSAPFEFRVLKILDRGAYGWAEFVQYEPVPDDAAAGRYYGRIGALLAVLYLLHGTDYHMGNLIASGEYPVAIDHECLLSPGLQLLLERGPSETERENNDTCHSVRSVGILPSPKDQLHSRVDRSVLGAYDPWILGERRMRCTHVNTDAMSLSVAPHAPQPAQNVLMVRNRPAYPRYYLTSISQGFVSTYRFLMGLRDGLGASDELFRGFAGQRARLIVRPSQAYADLLERITGPENHRNGVEFGLALERLARTYVDNRILPGSWPLLAAERAALMRGDIPVFHVDTSDSWIEGDGGLRVTGLLKRRSYDEVVKRWRELSDDDLERQRGLIEYAVSSGEPLLVDAAQPATRESTGLPPA